jgi:metallo-beta-lactamase class B
MKQPWEDYIPPFCIYGNLYFVGCRPTSSHLIDTGEGLILIDTGAPNTLYPVVDGIWRLGFRPEDVRIILHSHGHYDHAGATFALAKLTGAKTYVGAEDLSMVDGTSGLEWADLLGYTYREAFTPDVLIHDGDRITLGNTVIECVHTPGHTDGTYSFFFDAHGEEGDLRCGMFGGAGFNSMSLDFLDPRGLSHSCRSDFLYSLRRAKEERVDIFLGNHAGNNDTSGKAMRLRLTEGRENPFLHTGGEWLAFLDRLESSMKEMILRETPEELPEEFR